MPDPSQWSDRADELMARLALRGRDRELAQILDVVRQVESARSGAVVVVSGEPGIGKSALQRAVLEQAVRDGFLVGAGKAEEIDQIAPGAPLLLALHSGPQPLLDSAAFTSLRSVYDRRLWLVDRIATLVEAAAAVSPIAIAIDDVQWADPLTRFALRILPGRLAASPVLWLFSSRLATREVADELVASSQAAVPVTQVALGPLRAVDVDAIARARLGRAPDAVTRDLIRGAGGNPFWAVQFLDGLAWRQVRGLSQDGMQVELLHGVRRRLASLNPDTVAVARLAAVWARPLPVEVTSRVLGDLAGGGVSDAVREGVDNGLLVDSGTGIGFSHDLVRAAVYADIPPDTRESLHRLSGRLLLAQEESALAAAPHYRAIARPGDLEAVGALARAAADSAATMPDQAAELAQTVVSLVPPENPLWLRTGQQMLALLAQVQRDGAVVALSDTLIDGTADEETAAQLQVEACRALWAMGACREIERRVDLTLRSASISRTARARLLAVRALASTHTPSAPRAAGAAESALSTGRHVEDDLTQRLALLALTEAARNVGDHQGVLDRFHELRSISSSAHAAEEIRALQHLDRYDEADALLARARSEARQDLDRLLPSFLYAQIWQDHNLARLDSAEIEAQTLLQIAVEVGNFTYEMNARMVLCAVQVYRGDLTKARAHLLPLSDRAESGDVLRVSRLRLVEGWLSAVEGDLDEALQVLRPLVEVAGNGRHAWSWSPPWMRVLAGIGLAAQDRSFAQTAAQVADLGASRNPGVATMRGVAMQVRGLVDGDVDLLGRAVTVLSEAPRPLLHAQALSDHGAALTAAGQVKAGADTSGRGARLFESLGAVTDALAGSPVPGTVAARRSDPVSPGASPRGLASLTDAELRVAELIASGHSSRATATELFLSVNTVNTHLKSVFAKLDIRSRVQLANLVHEHGRATEEDPS